MARTSFIPIPKSSVPIEFCTLADYIRRGLAHHDQGRFFEDRHSGVIITDLGFALIMNRYTKQAAIHREINGVTFCMQVPGIMSRRDELLEFAKFIESMERYYICR